MLRFAILGAGHIAQKMARTVDFLRGEVVPYAVASRALAKAQAICAESGFQKAYGSYEELLSDAAVDLVYIATPNSLHYAHTRAALLAGKHVLCEKPFTMTVAEAEELFALAREKKRFLMEAVWTRFHPCIAKIREIIASGAIGEPRFLQATFALNIAAKERVSSPELGGGAIADLGIYPIHFCDLYFGLETARVSSHVIRAKSGVDDQSTITLEYADGRMASLTTSMTAAYGTSARIAGTLGCIELPQLTRCEEILLRKVPSGEETRFACPFDFNGYEYEVRESVRAIEEGRLACPECTPEDTLRVLSLAMKACSRQPAPAGA